MKLKVRPEKVIDVDEWDSLVVETYGRPYSFQQQDGCKDRGVEYLTVPDPYDYDSEMNDEVEEKVNGPDEGVKFAKWLERDPAQKLSDRDDQDNWALELWYDRNFYPHISTIANDLHSKGLLDAGEYMININW